MGRSVWMRGLHPRQLLLASALVALSVCWFSPLLQHAAAPAHMARSAPTTLPAQNLALPPSLSAASYYLMDPQTGALAVGYHADSPRPMASTTKIMTAVVALIYGDPNQPITVGAEVMPFATADASRMCCPFLAPGQRYTLRDLLYGLLLPSGDDAAATIAVSVAGSQPAFVARMNATAAWLGLAQTRFVNVHGLDTPDAANITTARDLARLTAFALTFPLFRQIVAQSAYTIPANTTHPAIRLGNTNLLVHQADSRFGLLGLALGVDGVKTGYTLRAGYCVVLDARHDGHEFIAVLLDEPPDAAESLRFADGAALLSWAFAQVGVGG